MAESDYKAFVRRLVVTDDPRTFLNSDADHAVDVLSTYFLYANDSVYIYAGSLLGQVGENNDFVVALCSFIEGLKSKLRILLSEYDEEGAKKSQLFRLLSYYKNKGKDVCVKSTSSKMVLPIGDKERPIHFTVVDGKRFRVETDIEKRSAIASANQPDSAKVLLGKFDESFNIATEVDLEKLFNDNN